MMLIFANLMQFYIKFFNIPSLSILQKLRCVGTLTMYSTEVMEIQVSSHYAL